MPKPIYHLNNIKINNKRGMAVRFETVHYFTEIEAEQVKRLVRAGAKPNSAKILVYLAANREATAAEIERGSGMRQPDVSNALKSQIQQGWISSGKKSSSNSGRMVKLYELAKPLPEITDALARARQEQGVRSQQAFVRKLRRFAGEGVSPQDARAS
jgi:predicted transcriptional regulator